MVDDTVMIHQFGIGPMDNFMYIIGDPETRKAAIIDPGWDVDHILRELDGVGYEIESVILTHGHYDHCNALKPLLDRHPVPVYISAKEAPQLTPDVEGLVKTQNLDTISIGNLSVQCFHTPGHSPGCQCLYIAPHLLTGDTLFVQGCGRCDLPGSDVHDMYKSLYEVISAFPDDTIIYPGHNYGRKSTATLAHLKAHNIYLGATSEAHFLSTRMGV